MTNQYEFSANENQKFSAMVGQMQRFAMTTIIIGIFLFLFSILQANADPDMSFFSITTLATAADSVVVVLVGIIWIRPAQEFKKIVTTQGHDVEELMKAFQELREGFLVIIVLLAIDIALQSIITINLIR